MQESNRNMPPHSVPLWQICDLSLTFISTFPLYRESPDNLLPIKTNHRHPSETSINTSVVWQSGNVYFVFESAVQPHCMTLPMFDIAFRFSSFGQCKAKKTHKLDNVNVYELFCKILQIFSALVRGRVACQQPCQQTSNPAIDRPFFFSGDINQC